MIEADVSLAETTRYPVPIMAHPPINISDITLEEWLVEVLKSHTNKGIKLDFKSTRVVEPAFRVLAKHADFLKGPLVLNADILQGELLLVKVFIFIFKFFYWWYVFRPEQAIGSTSWCLDFSYVVQNKISKGYHIDWMDYKHRWCCFKEWLHAWYGWPYGFFGKRVQSDPTGDISGERCVIEVFYLRITETSISGKYLIKILKLNKLQTLIDLGS